jgi:ATP-dependent DNA ligase
MGDLHTRTAMITRYKVTATGAIQQWSVLEHCDGVHILYGRLGGALQEQFEIIKTNKSGRSIEEQVNSRAQSRINKQLDKGYCYSIEEARLSVGLNASKLLKPMLAQQLKNSKVDFKDCFIQYKYNGHRCLIMGTEEGPIAYSRNGKQINTIKHITDSIDIPPGTILDGELYVHGMALQDAGSLIRKIQPGNDKLDYIIYDTILNQNYVRRLEKIMEYEYVSECVKVAPTIFPDVIDIDANLHSAIEMGYEGLILRTNDCGYEAGKRSKSLIKVKKWLDDEFLVTNVFASKDEWAILECICYGKYFKVSAPGTLEQKTEILCNKDNYIGRMVNVEFFEWTNDGVPFHPVAKYFRD